MPWLGEGGTQDMLIRAAACAAPCEFAVNYNGGHAADAITPGLGCYFGLLHIMDHYLMRRTSKALNHLDCFFTR